MLKNYNAYHLLPKWGKGRGSKHSCLNIAGKGRMIYLYDFRLKSVSFREFETEVIKE
jgi:hypothetical protein